MIGLIGSALLFRRRPHGAISLQAQSSCTLRMGGGLSSRNRSGKRILLHPIASQLIGRSVSGAYPEPKFAGPMLHPDRGNGLPLFLKTDS
ncbi:hypothetical protein AAII07_58220 [Microvirga sp. 0TCS3.31]